MTWFVLVESNTTGSGRLFCAHARELGLRPVVFAADPARYPYLAEDGVDTRVVDTADPTAVSAACAGLGGPVAGATSSSEYFVGAAGALARSLGLPHPDPDAIGACRDKSLQRARLRVAGVPGAAFAAARTPSAAVEAAARIGYPVVVKPVAGSGSIATRRCADAAAVRAAARAVLAPGAGALGLPPQPAVMVEEYLPGAEYSVETFDDRVVGVTRKHLGPEPHFVEVGHDFPAPLAPAARRAVEEAALAALSARGLCWGPAHVELRLTPAGPRLVEVNPRLAGGMIPAMVRAATGVDLIGRTVAKAAGVDRPPAAARDRAAAIRFLLAGAPGRLVAVDGVDAARRVHGVVEVGVTARPGQDVTPRHSFRDRLGYVVADGPDPAAAARAAAAGLRALRAHVAPPAPVP